MTVPHIPIMEQALRKAQNKKCAVDIVIRNEQDSLQGFIKEVTESYVVVTHTIERQLTRLKNLEDPKEGKEDYLEIATLETTLALIDIAWVSTIVNITQR